MKRLFRYYSLLLLAAFISLTGTGCASYNKMGTPNNQKSNLRRTSYNEGTQITRNTPNIPNTPNTRIIPNNASNQNSQDFRLADHVVKKVTDLKEVKTA